MVLKHGLEHPGHVRIELDGGGVEEAERKQLESERAFRYHKLGGVRAVWENFNY